MAWDDLPSGAIGQPVAPHGRTADFVMRRVGFGCWLKAGLGSKLASHGFYSAWGWAPCPKNYLNPDGSVPALLVVATGVPATATVAELQARVDARPARAVAVGDEIEWKDLPPGGLAKSIDRENRYQHVVMRIEDHGVWLGSYPSEVCIRPGKFWRWDDNDYKYPRLVVVALNVDRTATIDQLQVLARSHAVKSTACVGEWVEWDDVPPLTIIRATDEGEDNGLALRLTHGRGCWLGESEWFDWPGWEGRPDTHLVVAVNVTPIADGCGLSDRADLLASARVALASELLVDRWNARERDDDYDDDEEEEEEDEDDEEEEDDE